MGESWITSHPPINVQSNTHNFSGRIPYAEGRSMTITVLKWHSMKDWNSQLYWANSKSASPQYLAWPILSISHPQSSNTTPKLRQSKNGTDTRVKPWNTLHHEYRIHLEIAETGRACQQHSAFGTEASEHLGTTGASIQSATSTSNVYESHIPELVNFLPKPSTQDREKSPCQKSSAMYPCTLQQNPDLPIRRTNNNPNGHSPMRLRRECLFHNRWFSFPKKVRKPAQLHPADRLTNACITGKPMVSTCPPPRGDLQPDSRTDQQGMPQKTASSRPQDSVLTCNCPCHAKQCNFWWQYGRKQACTTTVLTAEL